MNTSRPPVVILNMAHTGLGIARNLRAQDVPVYAVTAKRALAGNYTRYAKLLLSPDSAEAPEELASFLCNLAKRLAAKPVLFSTRDQDVLFIERFREVLKEYFLMPIPAAGVLTRLLDKVEMAEAAKTVGVPLPRTRLLKSRHELEQGQHDISFPCVVKPVSSLEWRGEREWNLIGQRKAFAVQSQAELLDEYRTLEQVTPEILVQELIPGPDSNLFTFGCYLDRKGQLKGSFFGRKLLQYPVGFGTGFLLESAAPSVVQEYSLRILQSVQYRGVAECEFKLDPRDHEFKFIEVNVRHWDQHRLSTACGVNLTELAYLDVIGRDVAKRVPHGIGIKWIADDSFLMMVPQMLLGREITLAKVLALVRGRRVHGLFSLRDPRPFVIFLVRSFLPIVARKLWSSLRLRRLPRQVQSVLSESKTVDSLKPAEDSAGSSQSRTAAG